MTEVVAFSQKFKWLVSEIKLNARNLKVEFQSRQVGMLHWKIIAKRARSRQNPAEIIMDANYVDARALLANTPAQAESLLITWSRQQEALVSMKTYKKKSLCILIKKVPSPQ